MLELDEQISEAFTGESDCDDWWEPEVPADLLDATPSPKPIAEEELQQESQRYRRVVVRQGRGIPLVLIAAVGGSLLFHLLIWGGLLMALLFYVRPINHGDGSASGDSNAGGSGAGYMILGAGSKGDPALAGKIPNVVLPPIHLPTPPAQVHIEPPAIKPTPKPAIKPITPAPDPVAIGIPADLVGTPKPPAPPAPKPVAPITPPEQVALVTPPTPLPEIHPPSPGGKTALVAHSPKVGPGDGGDDNDDEPIIDITKPGKGGEGFGTGNGQGNGIDRGESGADVPEPLVKDFDFHPQLDIINFPKRNVVVDVIVLPNGRAGKITQKQSCGLPEIDAAFVQYIKEQCHFRPAMRAGIPIESNFEMAWGPETGKD